MITQYIGNVGVVSLLTVGGSVVVPAVALPFTWRSAPRWWVPLVGIGVLCVLWTIANGITDWRLF